MSTPTPITSGVFAVRMRDDMPREVAAAHWAGRHAEIMRRLPHIAEYIQQQFSPTDHGYWPSSPGVGTDIPADFRLDGFAEIRFPGMSGMLLSSLHSREILHDEQNLFLHVVGQLTGPGGGRWWPEPTLEPTRHMTAVLFRRRRFRRRKTVSRRAFRNFLHDELGPALHEAGARDLRTYTFIPSSKIANRSPGVSHAYPVERRIHGGVVFGADSRPAVDEMLKSGAIAALVERQAEVISGAYAYTIERSDTVIDNLDREAGGDRLTPR